VNWRGVMYEMSWYAEARRLTGIPWFAIELRKFRKVLILIARWAFLLELIN